MKPVLRAPEDPIPNLCVLNNSVQQSILSYFGGGGPSNAKKAKTNE
jgi:hypothetical protein